MNHTVAPWRLTHSNCWIVANDPDLGDIVLAKMDAGTLQDARLLAAAPNLLQALRDLLGIPDFDGTNETSKVRLSIIKAARAAINKATQGETLCTV
jgi:hypothetical protein